MTVTYDPEEDTLRILFRNAPIHGSEVHPSGLILDFDQNGAILGLELASASDHISRPDAIVTMETILPTSLRHATAPPHAD